MYLWGFGIAGQSSVFQGDMHSMTVQQWRSYFPQFLAVVTDEHKKIENPKPDMKGNRCLFFFFLAEPMTGSISDVFVRHCQPHTIRSTTALSEQFKYDNSFYFLNTITCLSTSEKKTFEPPENDHDTKPDEWRLSLTTVRNPGLTIWQIHLRGNYMLNSWKVVPTCAINDIFYNTQPAFI